MTASYPVICPACGVWCRLATFGDQPHKYRLLDLDGHGHAGVCPSLPRQRPARYRQHVRQGAVA